MQIGGYHVLFGLLYVLICGLLTWGYLIAMYQVFYIIRFSLYKIRYSAEKNKWISGQGANPEEVVSRPSNSFINKILFRRFVFLVVIAYLAIYAHQRFTWMKSDSMYPAAKEYFFR